MSSKNSQPREKVPNVEEQVRRDRLGDIDEARGRLRDAREETRRWLIAGRGTYEKASQLYFNQLKSFLLEVLPYAETSPTARAYWVREDGDDEEDIQVVDDVIGGVTVNPPPQESDKWQRYDDDIPSTRYEDLQPVVVDEWRGLLDVLRAPDGYTASFSYKGRQNALARRYTATVTGYPSLELLDDATVLAYQFTSQIGLDLGLGDDLEDAELSYEDLLP